jgi:hypothetical protein
MKAEDMERTNFLTVFAASIGGAGMDVGRTTDPFHELPLWAVFVGTSVIILFAAESGLWLGRYVRRRVQERTKAPIGEIVAAMLGLLAFMLGFTFSLAATRFDGRRMLVLEEANAIGTTYLRAGLLAEPHRSELRRLLREYVKTRIVSGPREQIWQAKVRSEELHKQLWSQATEVGEKNPASITVGLFISSLNETIDLHAKRVQLGMRNQIPILIWAVLYLLAVLAIGMMGYHTGIEGAGRFFGFVPMIITFSMVLILIADLDRPQEGLLKVSQQSLIDLLNSFDAESPASSLPNTP